MPNVFRCLVLALALAAGHFFHCPVVQAADTNVSTPAKDAPCDDPKNDAAFCGGQPGGPQTSPGVKSLNQALKQAARNSRPSEPQAQADASAKAPQAPQAPPAAAQASAPAQNAPAAVAQTNAPAQDAATPPVAKGLLLTRLPNGFTVLVLEDKRFPLVAERLYVRAGSAYEAKGQKGISHLLEHMVFNSTQKRPKGHVASDIESAGGDVNASTSYDYTRYMADLPSSQWKLGLNVFEDMIFGAKFDPAELEQEKKVVIAELEQGLDNPGRRLFEMSGRMVWRSMPYEDPVIGYRGEVQAVTSDDLRAYIKRLYQPQSMLLVVVGDVDAHQVYQEAQRVFGNLADDQPVTPPDVRDRPPATTGPESVAQAGNWQKCSVRLNFFVPGQHSAKDVPLDVLADVLGGQATSRLYRKFVYEQELAEWINVSRTSLEQGGMLSIAATVAPEKLDRFWRALTKDLAGITAKSFSDQDLSRSTLEAEDSLYRAKETLGGLATKLGYYQFFGFGLEGEQHDLYALHHLRKDDLQGLLTTYLRPENASLALLIPGQDQAKADAQAARMLNELKTNWPVPPLPAKTAESDGQVQKPEIVDLGNGRTVAFLPDTTMPYTSFRMIWRGGDSLASKEFQGLGALTASALTRSTPSRSATELRNFLADRVSSVSAASGRDVFTLAAHYPSRFAADIQAVLSEIIGHPVFDPAEISKIKNAQLAQITQELDHPRSLAGRSLFPFLFPESHYGYVLSGEPDRVKIFTPADARRFWERQRKAPWTLAVCGTFDRKAVLDMARKLAAMPAEPAPDFTAPTFTDKRELSLTLKGREQSHLYWMLPVPGALSPDTPALQALNTALTGQGGILFRALRDEQGLGYSVGSQLWQTPKTGLLVFTIATTPDKTTQSLDGFKKAAAEVAANGITAEQLDRAKNSLAGDYYQGRQSLDSRADSCALNLTMGRPMDFDKQTLEKVQALTPAQVNEIAKKYLDASKAYLVRVDP